MLRLKTGRSFSKRLVINTAITLENKRLDTPHCLTQASEVEQSRIRINE